METELICHKGVIYSVPRLEAILALLKFARIETPVGKDNRHRCPEITYRGQRLLNERFDLVSGGL
jgi:hypothetical protein